MTEDTARTKKVVRKWAGLAPDDPLVLEDMLDSLRPNARAQLRVRINEEFKGEAHFPVPINAWDDAQADMKLVRNLRDFITKRTDGDAS
jgi:hypothetical protein